MSIELKEAISGLALLRVPFSKNQISKLPKPTKSQTDEVKADYKKGIRCELCNGWHHPQVVHLDYVGHAALTDRLLDADPNWNWEPMSIGPDGAPSFDKNGGLWIKLTVCGVTRMGYGHPDGKSGGDAIKEVIGDALRNAAMRFGAALDLWHKGDLHDEVADDKNKVDQKAAIDGGKAEGVLKSNKVNDLGDYVMTHGSAAVKGKALKAIDQAQLKSSVDHFLNSGKELTGTLKVSVHNAQVWLKRLGTQEPKELPNEDIPF